MIEVGECITYITQMSYYTVHSYIECLCTLQYDDILEHHFKHYYTLWRGCWWVSVSCKSLFLTQVVHCCMWWLRTSRSKVHMCVCVCTHAHV